MAKEILIHESQSTIFDIVTDTTTNNKSIQIKTKPPYHTNIFPNVQIVPYSSRCSLALNLCGESCYLLDFIYHLSETSFIVYCSSTKDVVKISNNENGQTHYLCKDNASIVNVDNHYLYLVKLNNFRQSNDFDAIFKLLSELTI